MLSRRRLTGASVAAALAALSLSGQSYADEPDVGVGTCGMWICTEAGTGGSSGSTGSGSQAGGAEGGGSDDKPKCTYKKANGYEDVESQPVLDSDFWEGHDPSDGGALWYVTCGETTTLQYFGPGGPDAEAVSPAVLAQRALAKMLLRGPEIGITPKPGGTGVVGMPVYLWTETGAETYGPNTATASAGGVTVTATAKVSRIVWSMGDGKKVVCTTAGTPYNAKFGADPSPDCGHRYTKASKYHVTATSTWVIDWTGGGQSGQLTEARDSAVDIAVGEVQVVN
ncbi:ATP/GTP-binding protein [Streptomyces anulatus]|uniref:ATP/GTP-binding protein n=1 Tax=Streptomyces anulatus TaxID=1892 RepID=UPI00386C865C|nr:ATP/GTP-binding protein [Streptomyces anulatus]